MDSPFFNVVGLDVHHKSIQSAVRGLLPSGELLAQRQSFGPITRVLRALADSLESLGVTHVALESTGVLWRPVWSSLKGRFTLLLINPRTTLPRNVAWPTRWRPSDTRTEPPTNTQRKMPDLVLKIPTTNCSASQTRSPPLPLQPTGKQIFDPGAELGFAVFVGDSLQHFGPSWVAVDGACQV